MHKRPSRHAMLQIDSDEQSVAHTDPRGRIVSRVSEKSFRKWWAKKWVGKKIEPKEGRKILR
jgi:hypothetical protein